jgi:formate dehydrogenase iron-sulfur subunit
MATDIKSAALLLDLAKCTACRGCQAACKQWNDLEAVDTVNWGSYQNPRELTYDTYTLIHFDEHEREDGSLAWLFLNQRCLHCTEAACVDVCPTGALSYNAMGFVSYEEDKCNGCGYCTQFCPFGIPRLGMVDRISGEAKSSKCTFCQDRTTNGLSPACAQACPTGAILFGDRDELVAKGKQRVEELRAKGRTKARLYGENELGGLHQMYVLEADAAAYGLPENPKYPAGAALNNIIKPLGSIAIGATLVGAVAAFFITRRNIHMEEVE